MSPFRSLRLFHKDGDYAAFLQILAEGLKRFPVDLLAFCLMPNHWHLVLRPRTDDALARLMHWIGVTHVRRHHQHYHRTAGGHLYQGRFKSFPVQEDEHFLIVCRYVEGNAVRARLCKSAERWRWCSLHVRVQRQDVPPLHDWPVDRPTGWIKIVNEVAPREQLEELRASVNRGRPFGDEKWVSGTAKRLGLEYTLRPPGRPPKRGGTAQANRK